MLLCTAVLATVAVKPVAGQGSGRAPSLAAIDSLVAHTHFREANNALDRWEREHVNSVTPAQRATALLLRGRMTLSADSARPYYVQLSIGYPSSPEAPAAFLKLGQIAVASNDTDRALGYFRRIVTDYPLSPLHENALAEIAALVPRKDTRARTETKSTDTKSTSTSTDAKGAFAIQVGTYRELATAKAAAKKLDKLGFEPRIVTVAGSSLARVRVGRFASTRAADDLMRRLRDAGYDAVVVDDARTETPRTE
jgi:hypothetical protein